MNRSNRPFKKQFKRTASNKALKALRFLFRWLPRWVIYPFAELLFFIALCCTKNLQKICRHNLRTVYQDKYSEKEYRKMAKQSLRNIGYSMLDMLFYVERPTKFKKVVRLNGLQNLDEALDKGNGVLGVTAHLGNFPLMFMGLVQQGYKINVIIRPMRNKGFSEFMFSLCDLWGINMIQTRPPKKFLRDTLNSLRRNELLFILFDEVPPEDGVNVEFFGSRVKRAEGPALFQARTNASILPIFIHKDQQRKFCIDILSEFKPDACSGTKPGTEMCLNQLTAVIERQIRQHPLQWGGWFNKRWQNFPSI